MSKMKRASLRWRATLEQALGHRADFSEVFAYMKKETEVKRAFRNRKRKALPRDIDPAIDTCIHQQKPKD